jgi:quinol monooxygenase YgiN
MLIVHATARITPDTYDALRDAAAAMVAATMQEPGCITYSFCRDMLDETLVRIVEVWQDEAALAAHFKTPHMAAFQAAIKGRVTLTSAEKYVTDGPRPLM